MGTLYINHDDSFIGKTDERLTVKADKKLLTDVPLLHVEGVVIFGRATISPAAVIELLERKIPMSFMTGTGRFLGRLEPELTKNIFVRRSQWEASGETPKAIHMVQAFVRGKLKNYRGSLMRHMRDYPDNDLQRAIDDLERAIDSLLPIKAIASLRGVEGHGSAVYWRAFPKLIRTDGFTFKTRNRRPPLDPVNAMLSFGYSLLRHDVQGALNIVGFDPYLGYLHTERYGRPSLALDLMEEFRPLIVDAIVLSAINRKAIAPHDFVAEPLSQAISLTMEGRKKFLTLYAEKKQSEFKHPVMGRKCTYQEAFELQARLLAKFLMDETDKYPPLVTK